MRPFDFKESWFDFDGKPLAGRVSFCRLHTTELEDIYDNQGYPAENPVFTEVQTGQLRHQVFLKDNTDYTLRFWKYIGQGDMTEDQDNWLFLYSCDVLWNVYGIEIDASTFQLVNNITALRALDPATVMDRDGRKVVQLGGYNVIGDKPTVMYVWNPYSIASDNGGSVIKVSNITTGRWELVNLFDESGVDVRHFGVFGADSRSDAADTMSLAIGVASTYAASINRPLYFPSNQGITWYKINGLNISGAIFAKNTKVFGNTGTSSRIAVRDQDTFLDVYTLSPDYMAVFTIAGDTVRTSWGVNSTNCIFEPELKLIVDSPVNTAHKDWSDIIIDVLEPIDHVQFTHCQLNAIGTVGDWSTFINMKVTEAMFQSGVDLNTVTVFDNDIIDLSDFPTTSTWLSLVMETTQRVVDFRGRAVDSSCENNTTSPIIYKNANFNGYVVKQSTCSFENCTGTVRTSTAVMVVAIKDCAGLTLNGDSSTMSSLVAADSVIAFGRNMTITTWNLTRTNVEDTAFTHYGTTMAFNGGTLNCGLSCASISAVGTSFNGAIATTTPSFIKCDFYGGAVYQNNIAGGVINFVFRNCNFYGGNGHYFSASTPNTVVNGEWSGNYSSLPGQFVTFDRTNIDPDEQHHGYIYDGNTGPNTLQKFAAKWKDYMYTGPDYPGTGDAQGVLQNKTMFSGWYVGGGTAETNGSRSMAIGYRGRMSRNNEHGGGTTLIDYYLTEFQMFSIGTQNIGVLAMTAHLPPMITTDMIIGGGGSFTYGYPFPIRYQSTWAHVDEVERLWYSDQVGSPKGIMFKGGYTWRITAVAGLGLLGFTFGFPAETINHQVPVTYEIKPA